MKKITNMIKEVINDSNTEFPEKNYAGWKGKTPAFAIGNMLEFHEGAKMAHGYRQRMVEADEIIDDAIKQNKLKDKVNPPDLEPYKVIKSKNRGENDFEIVLDTRRAENEFIFGMDCGDPKNKAWLEYWCLRLNRAFVNGWMGSQGISSWPDKGYYEELDRLFNKMQGKTV